MERYTDADIEVHMTNVLEGMPLDEIDEEASNSRARSLIAEALRSAFPGRSVYVYMDRTTYGPTATIAGYPDELDPEAIMDVVENTLAVVEEWLVIL